MEKKTVKQEPAEWLPAAAWSQTLEDRTGIDSLRDWLKKAARPVYWPPDRRRVRRELRDHIDERVEGLQNRGLSLGDARRETLKRMGDPAETGALLRQVHQPWLGWALGIARIVAIGLLLAVVVMLVSGEYNLPRITKSHSVISSRSIDYGDYVENYTLVAERSCSCSDKVQFGAFTVSCEEAVCRYDQWERISKQTDRPELNGELIQRNLGDTCYIRLRFTGAPWYDLPEHYSDLIRVVDDKGMEYQTEDADTLEKKISITGSRTGLCSWEIYIRFANRPEEAEWVDIILGEKPARKELRIYFGGWRFQRMDALPSEQQDFVENFRKIKLNLDGIVWEQRRWYDEQQGRVVGEPLFQLGHYGSAEGQSGEITFCVSQALSMGDEEAYKTVSTNSPVYYYGDVKRFVDLTLVFRGDTEQLPLFTASLREKLRIVDPARGSDAQEIEFIPVGTCVYQNVCVWRIVWKDPLGTERYELQYRQSPEESACVLRLDLETDVKEEENP